MSYSVGEWLTKTLFSALSISPFSNLPSAWLSSLPISLPIIKHDLMDRLSPDCLEATNS